MTVEPLAYYHVPLIRNGCCFTRLSNAADHRKASISLLYVLGVAVSHSTHTPGTTQLWDWNFAARRQMQRHSLNVEMESSNPRWSAEFPRSPAPFSPLFPET